jgi:peptidyl-prolyl cis-trans isomerase A (cyclophilin A)
MNKIKIFGLFLAAFVFSAFFEKQNDKLYPGIYAEVTTDKGKILLLLEYQKAPMTCANFIALTEGKMPNKCKKIGEPFYDGNKFHRVIANFMIQGGDPKSFSDQQVGYVFKDEFHPDLKHNGPGILSMANAGPTTNSSQFFITHVQTPWLDNKHSVFGRVIFGQDVVNAIQQNDMIKTIRIIRVGKEAEAFDAIETFKKLSGINF